MAYTVLNAMLLNRFARKRRDAGKPLADWLAVVRRANWRNLAELRRTFPSADGVNVKAGDGIVIVVTVFNVKGNHYRLLTAVNYAAAVCRVIDVLTPAKYSTGRWKDRL